MKSWDSKSARAAIFSIDPTAGQFAAHLHPASTASFAAASPGIHASKSTDCY